MVKMKKNQQGFTIIELLVATAVFSIVMVIILAAFLRVGQLYYKGIYLSKTQESTRNISDDIVNQLRLNGNPAALRAGGTINSHPVFFMCVGNKRYSFMSNNVVNTANESNTNFGLVRDTFLPAIGCVSPTASPLVSPTEMLSDKMRLVATGTGAGQSDLLNTCTSISSHTTCVVHVHIEFGDDDLLTAVNTPGTTCTGPLSGSQFCATTDLDTTIYPLQ
jgi:prepilin-type N-terminal cleavage/methylation domain-containing protein